MKSTISILMPVYNGMPYLPKAIEGIMIQTHKDWKLLISNNNSNDGTTEYLRTLNDPRIQVFNQPENIGASKNWSYLYDIADSEYAVFHAADDIMLPQMLSSLLSILEANTKCVLVCGGCEIIKQDGDTVRLYETYHKELYNKQEFTQALIAKNIVNVSSCMFRIRITKMHGIRVDESKKLFFDWALWLDIATYSNEFRFSNLLVNKYRIHPTNLTSTHTKNPLWQIEGIEMIYERSSKVTPDQNNRKFLMLRLLKTISCCLMNGDAANAKTALCLLVKNNKPNAIFNCIVSAIQIFLNRYTSIRN